MKFSVPTNWSLQLLQRLNSYSVEDIYGALDCDLIGGVRPTYALNKVDREFVKNYIEVVHSNGMKFNYILNAPCLNNMEYDKEFHLQIIEHLKWISDIGVDSVTVTIPYLIEIIKKQFPELKIRVSLLARVSSIQRVKFFEALGADIITLDIVQNRNFKLLEKIKKSTKCKICLLANDLCLYQCPFTFYHGSGSGHASQSMNPLKGYYINYCVFSCTLIRYLNPPEILKSRWIRPEDVKEYEKIGIDYLKISGREKPTEWILQCVDSYTQRRHKGNLFDILNGLESHVNENADNSLKGRLFSLLKKNLHRLPQNQLKLFLNALSKLPTKPYENFILMASKMPPGMLKKVLDVYLNATKPNIDNDKLDGFIDFFKDNDCTQLDCDECLYCNNWSEKVIRIDKDKSKEFVSKLSIILEDLRTSDFFE